MQKKSPNTCIRLKNVVSLQYENKIQENREQEKFFINETRREEIPCVEL